jgi:asparagine synthase (glutamine-hydrolysing)
MGAQAGVMFFNGRPVEHECRALIADLRPVAPDGVSAFAEHSVAMVYGAFHVWAGERSSQQPQRSPAGHVITWDGRLDNRDDLLLRLGGYLPRETSDAAIALCVFERWGTEGLRWLIGDWSAVIWDGHRRTLHLARDYMGVRPLYYYVDGQSVMWSTSLGELATRAGRADALDERFVALFMTLQFSTEVTPYEGIRAVPTATCVSFSAARTETRQRFWKLEPGTVRYRDKRRYEEGLLALWAEAVGTRLRADATVWAELSGGLDSSSVVCMADALIKDGRVAARAIRPVSHVTLQSPEGDERRFIAEVEARLGVRSEIIGVEEHFNANDSEGDWVTPLASSGVGLACALRVRDGGGRLVLSGRVGDVVMGCLPDNSVAVLDDFAEGRLVTALSNIRLWSRACRKPFVEVGWELVRHGLHARLSTRMEPRLNGCQLAGLDLLTARLQSIARDHRDGSRPACAVSGVRLSKRMLAASVLEYSLGARLNIPSRPFYVTYTYPFTHRPLVEFMLAIPEEELSAPGKPRSLMRRAFEGLVPARILRRVSKGYYPPSMMRAGRPVAASMRPVEKLEVVRRGWVDPQRLDTAIRTLIDGAGCTGGEVGDAVRLEQWLTSRHRRAPAATPKGKEVTTNAVLNA